MDQKSAFIQNAKNLAATAAQLRNGLRDIVQVWRARGYGKGEVKALTDQEAANYELLPSDLDAFIAFARQYENLMAGDATVPGKHGDSVNLLRTDI